jgi:hypothetical protein
LERVGVEHELVDEECPSPFFPFIYNSYSGWSKIGLLCEFGDVIIYLVA